MGGAGAKAKGVTPAAHFALLPENKKSYMTKIMLASRSSSLYVPSRRE
jgi:hypothetical protein